MPFMSSYSLSNVFSEELKQQENITTNRTSSVRQTGYTWCRITAALLNKAPGSRWTDVPCPSMHTRQPNHDFESLRHIINKL